MSAIESKDSEKYESSQESGFSVQSTDRWTRIKDSFKPAETIEEKPDEESASLNDIERANAATAKITLQQKLSNRHIQMIALGGSVGTGLLIGSGGSLLEGGPAALIIAWGLVGTMVFCTVHSLGELCVAFPVNGAFSTYATRFVDSSWGFAVGWNYAVMWLFVMPLELVAAAMSIKYWNSDINPVAWVAIFYVLIVAINFMDVKGYGEAEFCLTIFKVIAIVGFIILGVVLVCGGGPTHDFVGNRYWKNPGPFAHGFKGVASTFVTASYSLAGSEMVGLASAEVGNPRKVLPKAVRQVFWRVFLFYFLTLTLIGLLVPSNSPELLGSGSTDASASPFVLAIKNGGIKGLPSVFNAVILVSVISVGNSAIYGCSRTLQSLGMQGLAPLILAYVDRKGRPLGGLAVSAIFGLLCFLSASRDVNEVFNWLLSVAGLATIFSWFNISLCHVRFRMAWRHAGNTLDQLAFTSVAGIWGSFYSMGFLLLVLGVQFWVALFPMGEGADAKHFFQSYLGSVVILVFYLGHKLYTRNWRLYIPIKDIDVNTGRRDLDLDLLQQELEEDKIRQKQKKWYVRMWDIWC